MTRPGGITGTLLTSLWLVMILLAGCRTPEAASFSQVHRGMTQDEVLELLGPPSSRWSAPPPQPDQPPLDWTQRWHYGDTLSTTASAAMGPDIAPDGVWVVAFDDKGKVVEYRPPIPANDRFPMERPPK
ncbi:MAG: hypothetical protein MK116_10370 [Phycisphaerales bacterium]|nr:hypothetical protein [Phycisphaerales bacterium]